MYYIKEDPEEIETELKGADGHTYRYKQTFIETEYAWRKDQYTSKKYGGTYDEPVHIIPTYSDLKNDSYRSIPEVLGRYKDKDGNWIQDDGTSITNGFFPFYVYNVYERVPLDTSIEIKKVDKSDVNKEILQSSDLLNGAKFILEKYTALTPNEVADTEWNNAHKTLNSGTKGVFTFTELPVGFYKIVEKEYPAGHVKMASDPIIEIKEEDGELTVTLVNDAGGLVRLDSDDDSITIIVGNERGASLPSTGGPGTRIFYLVGLGMILISGMFLRRRARG